MNINPDHLTNFKVEMFLTLPLLSYKNYSVMWKYTKPKHLQKVVPIPYKGS